MKQRRFKFLIVIAVLMITILASTISALAADDTVEAEGLKVSVSADKEKYGKGDIPKLSLNIENTNDFDIEDIAVNFVIPDGLSAVSKDKTEISELVAGASESVSKELNIVAEVTGSTSNYYIFIIIGIAAVVVIAAIIIILLLMKKKKAKAAATLLVLVVSASCLLNPNMINVSATEPTTQETEADDNSDVSTVSNADYKRVSVHDPSVVKDGDTYYIFGSHLAWAKSTDLKSWSLFTNNVKTKYATIFEEGVAWAKLTDSTYNPSGNMWAPDVIYNKDLKKWCMYMSINGDDWHSSIGMATSDTVDGDYTYAGTVTWSGIDSEERAKMTDIYDVLGEDADITRYKTDPIGSTSAKVNAIDPNVFYDEDGQLWMIYGSWSAGIYILKLDNSTGLRDYNTTYKTESNTSDAYLGDKIAGGNYVSGEGAYVLYMNGYYYLFLSYGGLSAAEGYQMRIFRSEKPNGPYVDQNGASAKYTTWQDNKTSNIGYKLFGSYTMKGIATVQVAQGHNSAFIDDDGKAYVVYHTRFATTGEGHEVRVHQLFTTETGWLVAAPYEYSGETVPKTGYDTSEIVGEYEFVKHLNTTYYHKSGTTAVGIVGAEKDSKTVTAAKEIQVGDDTYKIGIKITYNKKGGTRITLNEDGTVTGSLTGTWKVTEGTDNVTLNLDGNEYSGLFVQQANEITTRDQTMTFTATGNNVTVWGIKTK